MVEKLRYEDSFVNEILVNKINELIDELEKVDDAMAKRIENHWKFHRIKSYELEERLLKIESALGFKKETSNGSDKQIASDRTDEKPQDDK
jgi:hypothetical protein